jgi:hypothetical protein
MLTDRLRYEYRQYHQYEILIGELFADDAAPNIQV